MVTIIRVRTDALPRWDCRGKSPYLSFQEAFSPTQAKKLSMVNSFHSLLAVIAGALEAGVTTRDRQAGR